MNINLVQSKKVGKKGREDTTTYRISRKKGQLTVNDVHKLKLEIMKRAEAKYKNVKLAAIVFRNDGDFKTATDENQLLDYFNDLVKDPDKFVQFDNVDFILIYS